MSQPGYALTLLSNLRLDWKGLPGTKTTAYYEYSEITARGQGYKTFYNLKLRLFVLS